MDLQTKRIVKKALIFFLSLSVSWWLLDTGYLHSLVDKVTPIRFLAEFVAGMLYTSFLTSPIALSMLFVIAESNNPIIIALVGGFGAVIGDLILIHILRKNVGKDLSYMGKFFLIHRIRAFLKLYKLDFLIVLTGAIIIASPFPDELGLVMLGATNMNYKQLALLTYILDTTGILLVVLPVNILM